MGNIVRGRVRIVGIRPAIWHHFGPETIPLEKQERTGVAGHDPEEWKRTVLMNQNRQLFFEPSYVFGSLRDGSKFTKKGRGTLQQVLSATLQIIEDRIFVDRYVPEEPIPTDIEAPVYLDVRSVKNPTTKGRNVRYRIAASAGWTATFSIIFDRTIVSQQEMKTVLIDAGGYVGLGDGRAIGFGRFDITACEMAND